MSETSPAELRRVITASSAGTLIEWYDFYLFGVMSTVIAQHFFPQGNEMAGYLNTLATFAAGFIVRPFGALVFGRVGDLVGRKHAFMVTLLIMGVATVAVGLIPDYTQIGVLAPILLVFLRLLQGLAMGGEYGGAATYVAEHSPVGRRGFFTSFIQTTATLGLLMALAVILGVQGALGKEAFEEWGWRIPFLLSAILVVFAVLIRSKLSESPLFLRMKSGGKAAVNPLSESFMNPANRRLVLIALFGATAGQGVIWYTGQFYAHSFMIKTLKLDLFTASWILGIALLLATPLFILFGHLSDRIGRKPLMMGGLVCGLLCYWPIYRAMMAAGGYDPANPGTQLFAADPKALVFLIFIQVVFVAMIYGPIAAFLVELFPVQIRYTSMSLPYHLGNGVFGGLTPFVGTYLVAKTGNPYAGVLYPMAIALLTLVVGGLLIKESPPEEALAEA